MSRRTGALGLAAGTLALALAAVPLAAPVTRATGSSVVVRPGDTLSSIALRHRTTVARLVAINHLSNPNLIFAGQRLALGGAAPSAASATKPAASAAPATRVHVVRAGEHLTGIAGRYGTTIDVLVRLNGIANPNRIFAGQQLVVPVASAGTASGAAAPAKTAASPTTVHRVTAGETLTAIAGRYGTTIRTIVALNHLANPNAIRAGDVLVIPGQGAASDRATTSAMLLGGDVVRRMGARTAVRDLIVAEAGRAGVPAALALALAWQESGWQEGITSSAGAIGVMQLLPSTADWVATSMLHASVDLRDTRQNIRAGVTLLAHYLARYHGSRQLALAAYYQGQRSVDEHGVYPVSQPYIASILAVETALGG
jgi:LysM repeat protein